MAVTRRRGEDLEAAIHDAVRAELFARGYAGLTFEGVAEAAATSKAVLYRRWPTKAAMVFAAMAAKDRPLLVVPDTGSLRGDLAYVLRTGNALFREQGAGLILGIMSDVDDETAASMRELIFARSADVIAPVIERARARGELGAGEIPPRAVTLPMDLLRHETLLRHRLDDRDIEELIEVCIVPLFVALSSGENPVGR